jgi:hypothetical protein
MAILEDRKHGSAVSFHAIDFSSCQIGPHVKGSFMVEIFQLDRIGLFIICQRQGPYDVTFQNRLAFVWRKLFWALTHDPTSSIVPDALFTISVSEH